MKPSESLPPAGLLQNAADGKAPGLPSEADLRLPGRAKGGQGRFFIKGGLNEAYTENSSSAQCRTSPLRSAVQGPTEKPTRKYFCGKLPFVHCRTRVTEKAPPTESNPFMRCHTKADGKGSARNYL